jgi:hypothetical protein
MKIFLLGNIPRGDDIRKDWVDWKEQHMQVISASLDNVIFTYGAP